VDDDPDFVEATRIVLETADFEVVTAANGDEALAAVQHRKPELIIMDVMMKGILDGLHASWQIQADPELRALPILMVSSITSSDYAEMFPTDENIPADNFLSKPVSPDRLVKEVNRLFKKATK
ncbi:MAG: response regulator, partial [Chloroflexota bacterium]|nr:response regulator [Chloroflexota bacterium]